MFGEKLLPSFSGWSCYSEHRLEKLVLASNLRKSTTVMRE